ncbi:MAG: trypsin-like peptidase domain-containing protein [Candidatus Micrarchaeota archaeon]
MKTVYLLIVLVLAFGIFGCSSAPQEKIGTVLTTSVKITTKSCEGEFAFSGKLTDARGAELGNKRVTISAEGTVLEKQLTDNNGKISLTDNIKPEWCGKNLTFSAVFDGDDTHSAAITSASCFVKSPTTLALHYPLQAVMGESNIISVDLLDKNQKMGISNAQIVISDGSDIIVVTGTNGSTSLNLTFNKTGIERIRANFKGNEYYEPSECPLQVMEIVQRTCQDGTPIKSCSLKAAGDYCNENGTIVFDCEHCGCASGRVCVKGSCITSDQKDTGMILELQKTIVQIEINTSVSESWVASGVVIESTSEGSTILTNRHVVDPNEDQTGPRDLVIRFSDNTTIRVVKESKLQYNSTIKLLSNDRDLSVIVIRDKTKRFSVEPGNSSNLLRGEQVVALGSPLGLQNSVSKGIVSNFISETGYKEQMIQTDAAINPGNSGGGLFLIEPGKLVGINTWKFRGTEGMNFAIPINEYLNSPEDKWVVITPANRCTDGTIENQCSKINMGYKCTGISIVNPSPARILELTPECHVCGCGFSYVYESYCATDNKCYYCLRGTTPTVDINNNVICVR